MTSGQSSPSKQLDGKVALITGAARGQGRAHALRFAEEGADLVLVDYCSAFDGQGYPATTEADLAETKRAAQALGVEVDAAAIDVRDFDALNEATSTSVARLGNRLDIVVANAAVSAWGRVWEISADDWRTVIDINLTGVWHTFKACIPLMIDADNGGSIIAISSVAGLKPLPAQAHYSASKHGLVGLARTAALELAPYNIRVNTIHPWAVDTPMATDTVLTSILRENPQYLKSFGQVLETPKVAAPRDIADAALWLASDHSRTVTGVALPVDLGATIV
ncbi:mycofactocin-coupled SDR family oxidoreductase [Gordonia rubripertincta]|uniref:Mycofactocin-coupled SDR family oxidoreductase n=1 Tax=Gordonia rubripertincta TaxID=36822 RepID=A0ABT4MWQ4_GORRU|nr:mycofactocin-coupled SDR family oxidoreductase [Gordonia rubripertincta]MCZ4551449.1 mycofactocin-coupled SDR family oxidoreductase [Gordonia rubripertincta]